MKQQTKTINIVPSWWAALNMAKIVFSNPKADQQGIEGADDILKQGKLPDELNFSELSERINQLKENGVNTTRWEVSRYFKVSFPDGDLNVARTLLLIILSSSCGLCNPSTPIFLLFDKLLSSLLLLLH